MGHKLRKSFTVPMTEITITVCFGEENKKYFSDHAREEHEALFSSSPLGLSNGSVIWVKTVGKYADLFHECSHAIGSIMGFLGADKEEEFKAYITGWLLDKILTWCGTLDNDFSA